MQTKLRKVTWLFVVSLLWTSPMSAATIKTQAETPGKAHASQAHAAPKARYAGVASWYGANRQGRKMANGRKFDRLALTAACWYFPLGTVLRVVNLENGNAVTVTVTDRGPNLRLHRVVDLSEAAAEQLGYLGQGLARVSVIPGISPARVKPEHAEFDVRLVDPLQEKSLLEAAVPLQEAVPDRPN